MVSLLWLVLLFCLAVWGAYYIITKFIPEEFRKIVLAIVGVFFLLILLGAVSGYIPNEWLRLPGG